MLDFLQNEARFAIKDVNSAMITPRNDGVRSIRKDDALSVCLRRFPYFQSPEKSPSVKSVHIKPIGDVVDNANATLNVDCGISAVLLIRSARISPKV